MLLDRTSLKATHSLFLGSLAFLFGIVSATNATQKGRDVRLTPDALFNRISPSVFLVEILDRQDRGLALGSGVAIGSNLLITNKHVIAGGYRIRVSQGGQQWIATERISHEREDLTMLSVANLNAPAVVLRTDEPRIGERVYAIGNPEGLELTLSEGLISGWRELSPGALMIQTSAAISHGSSGGGLFDEYGRLVGITSLTRTEGQNLNFAIPIRYILELVAEERRPKPKPCGGIESQVSADGSIHFLNLLQEGNDGSTEGNCSPSPAAEPKPPCNSGVDCVTFGMTYEEMVLVAGTPARSASVEGFDKNIFDPVKYNYGSVWFYFTNHVVTKIGRE